MEEDIEILEKFCEYEDNIVLIDKVLYEYQNAIENLIKAYKEKEIETKKDKETIAKLSYELGKYQAKSEEDEAVIEEMAEYLSIVRDCPNEDKGANLDCENRCSDDDNLYLECWKQYFRNKVKENKE